MRFKITLNCAGEAVIPINYQYELSSWIYSRIFAADSEFGNWLHKTGYTHSGHKKFRLFTFSNLQIPRFEQIGDRLRILSQDVCLQVSFLPIEIPNIFIVGLFDNQTFSIGDKYSRGEFAVHSIEKLTETTFKSEMRFTCLSPILVSNKVSENRTDYLSPESAGYANLLKNNLLSKIAAYEKHNNINLNISADSTFDFEQTSPARSRLVTVKAHTPEQSKLKGYMFTFKLKTHPEIMRIGYYAGFGEKNALGFGCGEILNW